MEASVLVGKSINLQRARELAYHRNISGLNKEILKIMKDVNYEQLDPFQQDAVARALGKSAGELGQMAQAERERKNILLVATPEQKKQLKAMEEMLHGTDKQKKNYKDLLEKQLQQMSNQTRINNISLQWHNMMMKAANKFLPAIDHSLQFIADHFDRIVNIASVLFNWLVVIPRVFLVIGRDIAKIGTSIDKVGNFFKKFASVKSVFTDIAVDLKGFGALFIKLSKGIEFVTGKVFKLFGWFGKILGIAKPLAGIAGFFGKWLNPIGWIITAIQFIINLFDRLGNAGFVKGEWGKNILRGLTAIGLAIYDTLLKPFVDIFVWIWNHLCGKSPSMIGLGMVKGLKAVGGMILNALLSPYKMAWNLIKKIPFVSHLFGEKNVGAKVTPEAKAYMNVERPTVGVDAKKTGGLSSTMDSMNDELSKKMDAVVAAINALRDDMKGGALTANVYIDSQKLDALMGRRLAYTGNLV